jgi:VanZ family protein
MRYKIAWGWLLIVAILHAIPGQDLQAFQLDDLFQIDKLVHAGVFAVAYWLMARPLHEQYSVRRLRFLVVALLVYGILLEFMQATFFEGRHADFLDWLADSIGVCLGYLAYRRWEMPQMSSQTSSYGKKEES